MNLNFYFIISVKTHRVLISPSESKEKYMSLDNVKKGDFINISQINDLDVKNHLIRFGIDLGSRVQCFQKVFNGPVVIKFNRQEIALGKEIAQNILVTSLS